jgi:hypothetical protein
MPYNIPKASDYWSDSARYAGHSLESAKNAFVEGRLELDEFEILVECILWEQIHPQEPKLKSRGMAIREGRMQNLEVWDNSFLHKALTEPYPPKPDDALRSVMPSTKSIYGATLAL